MACLVRSRRLDSERFESPLNVELFNAVELLTDFDHIFDRDQHQAFAVVFLSEPITDVADLVGSINLVETEDAS